MSKRFAKLLLALVLAAACLPLAAQTYNLQAFTYPYFNSPDTYALGINNHGAVVGYIYYHGPCYQGQLTRGFKLDSNGVFGKPIDDPNPHSSLCYAVATGINDSGVITGYYYDQNRPNAHSGFLITNDVFTEYVIPGSFVTEIYGINNKGDFVGSNSGTSGASHPFVSINGSVSHFHYPGANRTVGLGIAMSDTVVGYFGANHHSHAFLRGPAGGFDRLMIPGAIDSYAHGVNTAAHKIVGQYRDSVGWHGVVYDYTTTAIINVDYPDPNVSYTVVTGINSQGVIVGYVSPYDAQGHPLPVYSFIGTPQ